MVLPAGRSPAGGRRCRQAGRPPRAPTPSLVPPAWEFISHARFLQQTPPHPPASGATDAATGLCDRPVHQAVGRRQRARRLLQRFTRCRFSETPARGPRPPRTDAGRTCSHSAGALGPRRQGPGHELGSGDRHASGPGGGGSKQSRRDVRPSRPGGGVRGAAEHGELSRCRGAAPRPGGHRLATTAQTAVTRLPRVTLARGLGVGPGTTSEATIMPWPQPHAGLAERTVPSTCSCVRVNGSQVRDGQVGVRRRDSLRSGHWQLNLCPPEVTGCLFTRPEHSFITWRPEEGPASRPRSPQDRPRVLKAPDRSTAARGSWAETACGATAPPPGRAAARRAQDSPGRSPPGLRQKTEGPAPGRGGGRRALSPTRGHRRPGRAAQCPLQAALASAVGLQPFTVNTDDLRLLGRSRTSFAGRVFVDRLSPDS